MTVSENIALLNARVASAAKRANRKPAGVRVMFVTKNASALQLAELCRAVEKPLVGERLLQEASAKFSELERSSPRALDGVEKHFIGHVQSSKTARIAGLFDAVHSLDSFSLAEKLNANARALGKTLPVFVEINIAGEKTKFGITPEEAPAFCDKTRSLECLDLKGLMCLPPLAEPESNRRLFERMRSLCDDLNLIASMGTTNDFEVAVEEGSDLIRVGRLVFG